MIALINIIENSILNKKINIWFKDKNYKIINE
jgi:hypothetical protein